MNATQQNSKKKIMSMVQMNNNKIDKIMIHKGDYENKNGANEIHRTVKNESF